MSSKASKEIKRIRKNKKAEDVANNPVLRMVREHTLRDMRSKLALYGKCAIVLPTGVGKTHMAASESARYENVLYVYNSYFVKSAMMKGLEKMSYEEYMKIVGRYEKEDEKTFKKILSEECPEFDFRNIKFMTYYKLARTLVEDVEAMESYDLIILDECHCAGAEKTRERIPALINKPGQKILGLTATPERADLFDVIRTFFDSVVTTPYTLHDAFQDGIIKKPYYCFCLPDEIAAINAAYKEAALAAGQPFDDVRVKEVIKAGMLYSATLHNMPSTIRDTVNECVRKKSYMQFIVFFAGFEHMKERLPETEGWFKEAFPDHEVVSTIVSTEKPEYEANAYTLDELKPASKRIDLIACVNMLDYGGHLDHLTGIMMNRITTSTRTYVTQLGRALSSGAKAPSVIFDVVDNLHRKAVYQIKRREKVDVKASESSESSAPEYEDGGNRSADLSMFDVEDMTDEQKDILREKVESGDFGGNDGWYHYFDEMNETDFHMTGHYAELSEIIAKAVAEPLTVACNRVLEEHKKYYLMKNKGEEYPSTRAGIEAIQYIVPQLKDFVEWGINSYPQWSRLTVKDVLDAVYGKADAKKSA